MGNFEYIKINLTYNDVLVYDSYGNILCGNSNISSYDIHPWYVTDAYRLDIIEKKYRIKFPYHINNNESFILNNFLHSLSSHTLEKLLDNNENNFIPYEFDKIYELGEKFIYPIIIYNNDLFNKTPTINLDDKLITRVKQKIGKILIIQPTEGFFGECVRDIIWVSNLSKKYGFVRDDIIVVTPNMMAQDTYNDLVNKQIITDNVTIYPYSYFQHNLWFVGNGNLNKSERTSLIQIFKDFRQDNTRKHKKLHFLSFNRVVKPHRLVIFGELMSNEKLKGKSISSMGGIDPNGNPQHHFMTLSRFLNHNYSNKKKILDFYIDYDSTKHHIYDTPDLENNKASTFNKVAHTDTFVNVVTESLITDTTIFFSEKTFKPILACQPFIIVGNPHSLKKLKELGFKTFDKWWDESYDEELDPSKRLDKIIKVMEEISTWDMEKCFQITNEMDDVFVNNFKQMIDAEETYKLYSLLKTHDATDLFKKIIYKIDNKHKMRLI